MKTLVAIPTFNEAENIAPLLDRIFECAPDLDVVVIDDASKDGTAAIVESKAAGSKSGKINIIKRSGKLGLGTAYLRAFEWAMQNNYDAVIEMDADFSHNPTELPKIISALKVDPVVVCSRYIEGGGTENWSLLRQLISRCGTLYTRIILGLTCSDATGGFNGWRTEVLRSIDLGGITSEGYAFQIELKYRSWLMGYNLKELPIHFVDRRAGQSKMSYMIVVEAVFKVWQLRFSPIKRTLSEKKKSL